MPVIGADCSLPVVDSRVRIEGTIAVEVRSAMLDKKSCFHTHFSATVCIVLMALTLSAYGADTLQSALGECTAIENDGDRLTCFDAVAMLATAGVEAPQPRPQESTAATEPTVASDESPAAAESAAAIAAASVEPVAKSTAPTAVTVASDDSTVAAEPAAAVAAASVEPVAKSTAPTAVTVVSDESTAATEPTAAVAAASVEPVAESTAPTAGTVASENVPLPVPDDLGIERVKGADREAAPEYSTVVSRCEVSKKSNQTYFFLENGQVWRQSNYRRLNFRDCRFDATLSKDTFGYKLFIPSKDRKVRVTRIR